MEMQAALYYTDPLSLGYPNLWLTCIFEAVLTIPVTQDYHLGNIFILASRKPKLAFEKWKAKYIIFIRDVAGTWSRDILQQQLF